MSFGRRNLALGLTGLMLLGQGCASSRSVGSRKAGKGAADGPAVATTTAGTLVMQEIPAVATVSAVKREPNNKERQEITPPPTVTFKLPAPPADDQPPIQQVSAISRTTQPGYGHAPDYSWIQGRIQRAYTLGGVWQLRYLPHDQRDRFGGSVFLVGDLPETLSEGSFVRVAGSIADAGNANTGARYRVRRFETLP